MPASAELLQKGRYRVDSSAFLGSGSVYPAYDTTSDTNVFVKEIVVRLNKVTTLSQQENSRLAFENAARRISEMRHDAILQVKDFYSDVGRQYLVLENVDGDDLQMLVEKTRTLFPVEKVLDWADQLLDAVNYLHIQGVILGNICPRNVRLSPAGKIKLLGLTVTDDTGNDLSTAISETNDGSLNFSPLELIWDSLDAASQKVITSSYDERSEKILKEPADVRSDLYSVGATLYYLLTARTPVDPLERSIEILEGKADPLTAPYAIDSRIAPEISDVVMRALEIKRENRYDSAMIMRQVLRTAVVRAKERDAIDKQELEEAAEILRNTQQLKLPAGVSDAFERPAQTTVASSDAGPLEAEILAQKLREAEEMRLEAERRAAEAERLLREQEAEKTQAKSAIHVSNDVLLDDDLLGITAEPVHVSNPPADATDDEIHLSIKPEPKAKIDLRELARAPEPVQTELPVETRPEPTVDVPEEDAYLLQEEPAYEEPQITSPAPVAEPGPTFSSYSYEDEPKRSGLPIPMIAGALAVLLIAAVGGFMFLGGSSPAVPETQSSAASQQPQTPAEQPATEVPAQTAEPQPEQQVNSFSDTEPQPIEPPTETPESQPATKPVQTAKAKPNSAAKKSAPAKKKVTVDDLINDN